MNVVWSGKMACLKQAMGNYVTIDLEQFDIYKNSSTHRRGEWFLHVYVLTERALEPQGDIAFEDYSGVQRLGYSYTQPTLTAPVPELGGWFSWYYHGQANYQTNGKEVTATHFLGFIPPNKQKSMVLVINGSWNSVTNQYQRPTVNQFTKDRSSLEYYAVLMHSSEADLTGFDYSSSIAYTPVNAANSEDNFIHSYNCLQSTGYAKRITNNTLLDVGGHFNMFDSKVQPANSCSARSIVFIWWNPNKPVYFQDYVCQRSAVKVLYSDSTIAILDCLYHNQVNGSAADSVRWSYPILVKAINYSVQGTTEYDLEAFAYYDTSTAVGDVLHTYELLGKTYTVKQASEWSDSILAMRDDNNYCAGHPNSLGVTNPHLPSVSYSISDIQRQTTQVVQYHQVIKDGFIHIDFTLEVEAAVVLVLKAESKNGFDLGTYFLDAYDSQYSVKLPLNYAGNVYVGIEVSS